MANTNLFVLKKQVAQFSILAELSQQAPGIAVVEEPPTEGLEIFVDEMTRLSLRLMENGRAQGAVCTDLTQGHMGFRRRKGVHGGEMLLRALGYKRGEFHVLDTTLGLGVDTLVMWGLGCYVTAIEKSRVIFEVFNDGVKRASLDNEMGQELSTRLQLICANSLDYFKTLSQSFDAIYLDPMFPEKIKSAKSPKEMQVLQALLNPSTPEEILTLWELARSHGRRTILKRPLRDRSLNLPKPTFSVEGRSIRYDVWA